MTTITRCLVSVAILPALAGSAPAAKKRPSKQALAAAIAEDEAPSFDDVVTKVGAKFGAPASSEGRIDQWSFDARKIPGTEAWECQILWLAPSHSGRGVWREEQASSDACAQSKLKGKQVAAAKAEALKDKKATHASVLKLLLARLGEPSWGMTQRIASWEYADGSACKAVTVVEGLGSALSIWDSPCR